MEKEFLRTIKVENEMAVSASTSALTVGRFMHSTIVAFLHTGKGVWLQGAQVEIFFKVADKNGGQFIL